MVADDRTPLTVTLSPGQAHDGVEGRKLLTLRGQQLEPAYLLMDRAYEGDATRQLAQELGYGSVAFCWGNRMVVSSGKPSPRSEIATIESCHCLWSHSA